MDADPYPGLENPVTFHHGVGHRIDHSAVEGVRQRADQPARGPARQLRVGVQRYDVPDPRQDRQVADLDREAVRGLAEQVVEVQELPALALPAHPGALGRVINVAPVEKEE